MIRACRVWDFFPTLQNKWIGWIGDDGGLGENKINILNEKQKLIKRRQAGRQARIIQLGYSTGFGNIVLSCSTSNMKNTTLHSTLHQSFSIEGSTCHLNPAHSFLCCTRLHHRTYILIKKEKRGRVIIIVTRVRACVWTTDANTCFNLERAAWTIDASTYFNPQVNYR